jgi:segregation and condensation protein B
MQVYLEQGEGRAENIIEAVLFASGEPVSFAEIAEALEISRGDAQEIILRFAESYNARNTGLEVLILEGNAQLTARAENIEYIRRVLKSGTRQARVLSKPALEILAITAYNQPVTRSYIEHIRGVDCAYILGSLVERGYIEEKGVLEVPGRPRLYGTTIKFLAQFGLSDLSELPEIEKFRESLDSLDSLNDIGNNYNAE